MIANLTASWDASCARASEHTVACGVWRGSGTNGRPWRAQRTHRGHHPRRKVRRRGAASYLINSPCLSSKQQTLANGPRRRQLPPLLILFLTSVFGPAAVRRFHLSGLKVFCSRLFSDPVMPTCPPPRVLHRGHRGQRPGSAGPTQVQMNA